MVVFTMANGSKVFVKYPFYFLTTEKVSSTQDPMSKVYSNAACFPPFAVTHRKKMYEPSLDVSVGTTWYWVPTA